MAEDYVNRRNIHWFPGHMTRTLRMMEKRLSLIDAVVQLLDARIPYSSLNADLQAVYKSKPRLFVLNKSDLADEAVTAQWLHHFKEQGYGCVAIDSRKKGAAQQAKKVVDAALLELLQRRAEKGMEGAKTRLMITGIPNVGKSTFINSWVGATRVKAADKPGVTRGEQWITTGDFELLDVPGVLPKRLENPQVAANLAWIGSIPDHLLNSEEIAAELLQQVAPLFADRLATRFKLNAEELPQDGWELLTCIGKKRGMLISGGEVDTERAAIAVLDEFRGGKLGRFSLEVPK